MNYNQSLVSILTVGTSNLYTPSTMISIFFHGRWVRGWPSTIALRNTASRSAMSNTVRKITIKCNVIGVSLSEPHITHDSLPTRRIMVCIYLCLYHLPCVCCTIVPEISVHSEMLCVCWYIEVLIYVIYSTRLNSKDDWSYSCLPWRLSTKTGRWMCRHMAWMDSVYWDNGAVAAR